MPGIAIDPPGAALLVLPGDQQRSPIDITGILVAFAGSGRTLMTYRFSASIFVTTS